MATERSFLAVVQHGDEQHEQETELVTIREEDGLTVIEAEGLRITEWPATSGEEAAAA